MIKNFLKSLETLRSPTIHIVEESCAKKGGYLEKIDTFIFSNELC